MLFRSTLVTSANWQIGKGGSLSLNVGSLTSDPSQLVQIKGGTLQNNGNVVLSGARFTLPKGYLSGSGNLELDNRAELGWQGNLKIGGNFKMTTATLDGAPVPTALDLEIDSASSFSHLTVGGTASLDGQLDLSGNLAAGTYRVLTAKGGVSGQFGGGVFSTDQIGRASCRERV